MKRAAKTPARSRPVRTRTVAFGALVLAGLFSACSTTRPRTAPRDSIIDKTARSRQELAPWQRLKSIQFSRGQTDLPSWESAKIDEIVTYLALHPGAELGINLPIPVPDGDRDEANLNSRRILTVTSGLIAAGVSSDQIHTGAYAEAAQPSDQQVDIFIRFRR